MTTKIDVFIPTKNSYHELQTILPLILREVPINRLIIVDKDSQDGTIEYLKKMAIKNEIKLLIIHQETDGVGAARKIGLDLIETPIFASFDVDVEIPKGWYSKLKDHFDKDKVAIVTGATIFGKPGSISLQKMWEYSILKKGNHSPTLANALLWTNHIRNVGGFNAHFHAGEDSDLRKRLWDSGYEWIIDKSVICSHPRTLSEDIKQIQWWSYYLALQGTPVRRIMKIFLRSFRDGFNFAVHAHPTCLLIVPFRQFIWVRGYLKNLSLLREMYYPNN